LPSGYDGQACEESHHQKADLQSTFLHTSSWSKFDVVTALNPKCHPQEGGKRTPRDLTRTLNRIAGDGTLHCLRTNRTVPADPASPIASVLFGRNSTCQRDYRRIPLVARD